MAAASAANPKQIRLCELLGLGKSFKTLKVSVDNSALSCGKQEGSVGDDCPSRAQFGLWKQSRVFQCFKLRCWTGNGESGGRWNLELLTATASLHCEKLWVCQHSVAVKSGEGSVSQVSAAGMKGTGKRDDCSWFSVHCLLWKGISHLILPLLFLNSSPQSTMCGC